MTAARRVFAGLLVAASMPLAQAATDPSLLAGVAGAKLVDSGTIVVADAGPFSRAEAFEMLDLPDGRHVLLNTITAADGAYRVQARFDFDAAWQSVSAQGIGLYGGKPVAIEMRRDGARVAIRVTGDGVDLTREARCDPTCLINTSPSATAMFVMTRLYDVARGGPQNFLWAGQDLDRERTLTGGGAALSFVGTKPVARAGGGTTQVRHYSFVESLPTPEGGIYRLDFDLWTDDAFRPLGFRIRAPMFKAPVIGFRKDWDDVRSVLTATP